MYGGLVNKEYIMHSVSVLVLSEVGDRNCPSRFSKNRGNRDSQGVLQRRGVHPGEVERTSIGRSC